MKTTSNHRSSLGILISVFFFWGFIAASNGIFIPFCKNYFNLSQFESQLIDFAFYVAYFSGSLLLFLGSQFFKVDFLNKIGYKKGIIIGLIISTIGALSMIPAVKTETKIPINQLQDKITHLTNGQQLLLSDRSLKFKKEKDQLNIYIDSDLGGEKYNQDTQLYILIQQHFQKTEDSSIQMAEINVQSVKPITEHLFKTYSGEVSFGSFLSILLAFFIIGLGFSLQQTAAQPFVIAMGSPETGAHRLNLAGGINSLGTLLGPIVVAMILFGSSNKGDKFADIDSVSELFYILSAVFLIVTIILGISKLPQVKNEEPFESGAGALKFPQLRWGMIAIFTYVGVEVTIQSNMGELLKKPEYGGLSASQISQYISLYWGSLMIGRWVGAISVFNLSKSIKRVLTILVPYIAFAVILLVNEYKGNNIQQMLPYGIVIIALIIGFFIANEKPSRTLLIFGIIGIIGMLVGLFAQGQWAVFAFLSGGLCCSIMWPCIFAMSITGLGKYTGQGSAFLIMMILGGAIIPPLQGLIADEFGIVNSYWIPVICFIILCYFAIQVKGILKKQGYHIDENIINISH